MADEQEPRQPNDADQPKGRQGDEAPAREPLPLAMATAGGLPSWLRLPTAKPQRTQPVNDCYIVFAISQHGHHAHITVTHDALFETPEKQFAKLGPLSIGPELSDEEIEQRVTQEMNQWLAQPANVNYLQKSANPVAVFHDARAEDHVVTSSVPQHIVSCILNGTKVYAKTYSLDPLFIAQWCK